MRIPTFLVLRSISRMRTLPAVALACALGILSAMFRKAKR